MIFDPIDRIWIFGGFQPSVHSETASSVIFYLWLWKMTFFIVENPGILWDPCRCTAPKDPCNYMVYTWALKGVLVTYFGVYVRTISILGPCRCEAILKYIEYGLSWDRIQGSFQDHVLSTPVWLYTTNVQ